MALLVAIAYDPVKSGKKMSLTEPPYLGLRPGLNLKSIFLKFLFKVSYIIKVSEGALMI